MRTARCLTVVAIVLFFTLQTHARAEESDQSPIILGGLKGQVQIIIDKHGIPHIYADNESDALFALGYMHARDRLWQMDFSRRAAGGKLAEVMGPDALEHDVFIRTIGINRLAMKSAERLKGNRTMDENINAYAWGINSYIAGIMPENLPPEFGSMGYHPGPWTPQDSIAIGKAMAWELCGSLDDLYLASLIEKLGQQTVDELFPIDRYKEVPIIPGELAQTEGKDSGIENAILSSGAEGAALHDACLRVITAASHGFRILGNHTSFGSNNWVVDGTKSASGKPMLASDPHLGFNLPSIWYAAHIKTNDLDVIGVTMPGMPYVLIGQNRTIAWGITNTQADGTDFYVETLNEEKTQYLYEGEWKPLEVSSETINVRGQEPQELIVHATGHGPLLPADGTALSIKWIGAEPDEDLNAFYLLNHAVDYDDFAMAMQTMNTPPQNFAYADANGMIAMWVSGLFPVRRTGLGRVPMDGSSAASEWAGFIPRIDTPHSVNPSQHYLASANQRPAPKEYPYYLGYEWDPGYRARRINQLLSSNDTITVEQMKSFQADTFDTAAESMLPHLIAACKDEFADGKPYAEALDVLSQWDFLTKVDSPAPTIWWTWLDKFRDIVWQDEWKAADIDMQGEPWGHADLNKWQPPLEVLEQMVAENPTSKWFDDVTTETRETLTECASASLRAAVDDLRNRFGPSMSEWNWGVTNRLRIDHLSGEPMLGRGGHPLSGSDVTLCARGTGGDVTGGPSWRMVVDFSDRGSTVGVYPGGQSGNAQNPHYDDLIDIWARDEYISLNFHTTPEEFPEKQVEDRIILSAPPPGEEPATP